MDRVSIGGVEVSRLILGGNPFSAFSHRSVEMNAKMERYYTSSRIRQTLREAESLGINTFIGRADRHITRLLIEYWQEGGGIQWIAQSCPEYTDQASSIERAASAGAVGAYVHGGWMDHLLANGRLEESVELVDRIRDAGLVAGIGGHDPRVFRWAIERRLPVDFCMCSYYNPLSRRDSAEHRASEGERYLEADRAAMSELISALPVPAVHFKVMAAGRNDPAEALSYAARHMREGDAVCVGVYTEEKPDMLAEDVRLLEAALQAREAA